VLVGNLRLVSQAGVLGDLTLVCEDKVDLLDVLGATPLEALSCPATQLVLRHVQPTAMFGRVVKLKTLDKRPGLFGRESFIKGSLRMGVEVVTDQQDFLGLCKASREQFLHLQRPVNFGALRTSANLPQSTGPLHQQ